MGKFETTRWSLLIAAKGTTLQAASALEQLCRIYRPVVQAQIRRQVSGSDAEDLTQAFFEQFLRQRMYAAADPDRGRFRAYIRVALGHFLSSQELSARRLKRGGGSHSCSLSGQAEYAPGMIDPDSPDTVFDRDWAQAVIAEAVQRLQQEASQSGKARLFEALRPYLFESPEPAAASALSAELGIRRNTLAVALHRLRQRLHQRVCDELVQTLIDPADLDSELARLQRSCGRISSPGAKATTALD
ncbi:MAG: hypothetical protein KDI48_10795 [Xanthomonadales bacterium]|nr:hypothetical protein [Xanthomonadales bacterium]